MSSVMQIVSGLNNAAVGRLKRTWAMARKKNENVVIWDEIASLMNPEHSYRAYRAYLVGSMPNSRHAVIHLACLISVYIFRT